MSLQKQHNSEHCAYHQMLSQFLLRHRQEILSLHPRFSDPLHWDKEDQLVLSKQSSGISLGFSDGLPAVQKRTLLQSTSALVSVVLSQTLPHSLKGRSRPEWAAKLFMDWQNKSNIPFRHKFNCFLKNCNVCCCFRKFHLLSSDFTKKVAASLFTTLSGE